MNQIEAQEIAEYATKLGYEVLRKGNDKYQHMFTIKFPNAEKGNVVIDYTFSTPHTIRLYNIHQSKCLDNVGYSEYYSAEVLYQGSIESITLSNVKDYLTRYMKSKKKYFIKKRKENINKDF